MRFEFYSVKWYLFVWWETTIVRFTTTSFCPICFCNGADFVRILNQCQTMRCNWEIFSFWTEMNL